MVLFPDELVVSKSMRSILRKELFTVTFNKDFRAVISNCSYISRNGQRGTWITDEMIEAYVKLHELGYAKSVEVWRGNELVGGLYGIDLGNVFCGESMFSKVSNASKVAFITLVQNLKSRKYALIDCQVHNDHLESLGAKEIEREDFIKIIKK
jgi:leucyl/phenylalanyl-tRNA--protein transferase